MAKKINLRTIDAAREVAAQHPEVTHLLDVMLPDGQRGWMCSKISGALMEQHGGHLVAQVYTEISLSAERQVRIWAAIPGLEKIEESRREWDRYEDKYERAMETSVFPAAPAVKYTTVRAQYPVADAYLTAQAWGMASHDVKSCAGSHAAKRIEAGDDYQSVMAEMETKWSEHVEHQMAID